MNFFFFDYRLKNLGDLEKDLQILKDLGFDQILITIDQVNEKTISEISKLCTKNDFIHYFGILNKKHKKFISIFEPKSKEDLNNLLKKYYVDVLLNPSSFVEAKFIIHGTKSAINKPQLKHIKNKALFFGFSYTVFLKTENHTKMYQAIQDLYVCYKSNVPTIISFSETNRNLFRDPYLIIEFIEQASNENIPKYWIRDCLTTYPVKLVDLKSHPIPGVKEL